MHNPPGGGPKGFSLSVTGRTKNGATVTPTVARPIHIGLSETLYKPDSRHLTQPDRTTTGALA